MSPRATTVTLLALIVVGMTGLAGPAPEAQETAAVDQAAVGRTPPRLSFVDGGVSFQRPGVADWAPALLNAPLAPGDELYTGPAGNFELQIGARAFVRAGAGTYLGLVNHEPDFLQFKVTAGHASLDLRTLEPGRTVELDTPNAVFTIEHTGYYRVDVGPDRTSFITRRGGRAMVTPAGGAAAAIAPSENVIVAGTETARVETYVAPQIDVWDRWNYDRTDHLIEAVSARYVSADVYGVDALDHYGTWRVVPTYGPVWVPTVPAGWVPYSTGTWVWDPYYRWTWVDTAPWGWAPYHYGRWVSVNDVWAWAPGPIVAFPLYAPALVAFFGGGSAIGWVALGWGEPCLPWWGPAAFIGRPWWAGWGGPRIVNNLVVPHTTVVHERDITIYQNRSVRNALIAVHQDRFGRGAVGGERLARLESESLAPLRDALVPPRALSPAPGAARAFRPSEAEARRPVVATRPQREPEARVAERPLPAPAPLRLVPAPQRPPSALESPRPPFGSSTVERREPPTPPRFQERRPESRAPGAPAVPEGAPRPVPAPRVERPAAPVTPAPRVERPVAPAPAPRVERPTPPIAPTPAPRVERPATPLAPTPAPRVQRPAAPIGPTPAPRVERPAAPAPVPRVERPVTPAPALRPAPARPLPGVPANRLYTGGDRAPGAAPESHERTDR